MSFTKLAAEIWRRYVTDGVPSSGAHQPDKDDIVTWGTELESASGLYASYVDMTGSGLVEDDKHKSLITLPADSTQITVTLDVPANLRSDFLVEYFNPPHDASGTVNVRRHRIIAQYDDFFLSPGHTVAFIKQGNTIYRKTPPQRWMKQSFVMYMNSSATATTYDGMVAGTSSAKKSLLSCVQTILRDIDPQGSNPKIIPVGSTSESITLSGSIGAGTLIYIEPASAGTFTWKNGFSPYALQVANGGTMILHNIDFARETLANVIFISSHQKGVVDVGDPNIGTSTGITFADAGASGSCIATDGAGNTININGNLTIKAGSYGTIASISGASSLNWTGGTTVTHTGTPTIGTYLQLIGSGANAAMASSIAFSGAIATGCTKFVVALNASLSLSGNTLPGSIAGSASAGGEYV